jgi:hypothetical protein
MDSVTFKITVLAKGKRVPDVIETRKFSLPRSNLTLETLYAAYGCETLLCYRDRENDLISLRTPADLEEFFRTAPVEDNIYRLVTSKGRDTVMATASAAGARVAQTGKQLAEEAIVLGVRGVSYVEQKWNTTNAPAVPAAPVTPSEPPMTPDSPQSQSPEVAHNDENNNGPVKSFVTKIAEGGKQLAEEALVLGVRGVSYVEHQWGAHAAAAPAAVPVQTEMQAFSVPPASPASVPTSGLSDSWVNVEQSVASAPRSQQLPTPVPVSPVEHLLIELVRTKKYIYKFVLNLLCLQDAMGFRDRESNIVALEQSKNNVEDAVACLLGDI